MSIEDRGKREMEVDSHIFKKNLTSCIGEVSWQLIKNARGRVDLRVG